MIQKLRILEKVSRQSEMLYFGDEDRSNKYFVKPCAESRNFKDKIFENCEYPERINWFLFRKYRKPFLVHGIEPENAVSFANGKFSEFQKQKK